MKDFKYSKDRLSKIVLQSKSYADVCRGLNMGTKGNNFKTVKKYISLYEIDTSHFETKGTQLIRVHLSNTIPLKDILVENSKYKSNYNLKNRLFKEGIKSNKCEICGLEDEWNGVEIKMQLDHINGINTDNRLENLRIICPNCHSQTETFCGKNNSKKFKKKKERELNGGRTNAEVNASLKNRKVKNRPSKEDLVVLIKDKGFSGVGRDFKVDGNTVKKWCTLYGISKYIKDYK